MVRPELRKARQQRFLHLIDEMNNKILAFSIALLGIVSTEAHCQTLNADTIQLFSKPGYHAIAVKNSNNGVRGCDAILVLYYDYLSQLNTERAADLVPVAPLCKLDAVYEQMFGHLGNLGAESDREAAVVSAVRKYKGDSEAELANRFIVEVVRPSRTAVLGLIGSQGSYAKGVVVLDNAIAFSKKQGFLGGYLTSLEKQRSALLGTAEFVQPVK